MDVVSYKLAKNYADKRANEIAQVVSRVEKNVNDYQATMTTMNPNQQVKQKAVGYGAVSLPKNSANGQVGASVKGLTVSQLFKNGNVQTSFNLTDTGIYIHTRIDGKWLHSWVRYSNTRQVFNIISGHKYYVKLKLKSSSIGRMADVIDINYSDGTFDREGTVENDMSIVSHVITTTKTDKANISFAYSRSSSFHGLVERDYQIAIDLTTTFGAGNEPLKEECDKIFANYFDGTKSTISATRLKSVGKNLFDGELEGGNIDQISGIKKVSDLFMRTKGFIRIKPSTMYNLQYVGFPTTTNDGLFYYDIDKKFIVHGAQGASHSKISPANAFYAKFVTRTGDNPGIDVNAKAQFEYGEQLTAYEPYTESTQYIKAKDEEGKVIELRSLPNGTKDEIRVSGGKAELVKRVSDELIVSGVESWDALTDLGTVLRVYVNGLVRDAFPIENVSATTNNLPRVQVSGDVKGFWLDGTRNRFGIKIPKTELTSYDVAGIKQWLANNPITLIYQLAEPIITPVEVSGTLLSNPNGTVYVENVVADAGLYIDKLSVLSTDLPIQSIEKLSKVDFTTGVETELDVSKCVVSEDKLSFTHSDLVDGDIVFFTYYHGLEGTLGETEIEYYDSRHTLKDSVTGKFYKVVPTVADGVLTNGLVEV